MGRENARVDHARAMLITAGVANVVWLGVVVVGVYASGYLSIGNSIYAGVITFTTVGLGDYGEGRGGGAKAREGQSKLAANPASSPDISAPPFLSHKSSLTFKTFFYFFWALGLMVRVGCWFGW